tara:strand:- start:68125 stop:68697 length:573 start_codon:yes stop_codon:yes gene_type:complete
LERIRVNVDEWFVEEVLPLEGSLERFLMRNWGVTDDIPDLRQDIYTRLYKAALTEIPDNTKAMMFATARNLLIDRRRRSRIVSIETVMDFEMSDVSSNEAGPFQTTSARAELRILQDALNALPDRTRDVIYLRKIEGNSQKETARILGISEPTVERHVSKGIRKLADQMGKFGINVMRPKAKQTKAACGE